MQEPARSPLKVLHGAILLTMVLKTVTRSVGNEPSGQWPDTLGQLVGQNIPEFSTSPRVP